MARIPLYTPQVAPRTAVPQDRVDARSLGAGIGAELAAAGDAMLASAARRAREDQRSEASVRLAQLMASSSQLVTDARTHVGSGGAGHVEAVLKGFDEAAASLSDGLSDQETLSWIAVNVAQERARLASSEGAFAAGKRADKLVTDFQTADDAERTALYANPDWAGLQAAIKRREDLAAGLDLPDDARAKLAQDSRYGLTLSYMQGLTERDPYAAQKLAESGQLAGMIDADRLQQIKNRADIEVRGIEAAKEHARKEAEAERRRRIAEAEQKQRDAERDVADRLRDARDFLANGGSMSAQELGQLTTAAMRLGKPELARGIQRLGLTSIVNTELRGASPAAIQATVNNLSARINAAGGKADPQLLVMRDAAEAKLASTAAALKVDPLSFAVREGVISNVPALDGTPASQQARLAAARTVQARYGGPLRLFTDEEADVLTQQLAGPTADALNATKMLAGFGGRAVLAAAQQVATKDPEAAHLAVLAAQPFGVGRKVLETVNEGKARLAGDTKLIDREARDEALNGALGSALALRPQLAGVITKLADSYYAGVAGRRGTSDFDDDLYKQSVSAVLGRWIDSNGVARGGLGTDRSGQVTLLPRQLSQEQFIRSLDGITDETLAKAGANAPVDARGKPLPADYIRNGQLLPVADGRYRVAWNGRQVMAKSGQPFELVIGSAP